MGAILCQQDVKGNFCVIAYASRALVKHEKNYTPFLLEMMAAVWAMEHFDNYLRGKKFTLFTDHRPLEKLATVHKKTLNRLQEAMMVYDFQIMYKSGKEMPADFLSRNVLAAVNVFTPDLPALQQQDKFITAVRNFMLNQIAPADPRQAAHVKRVAKECFLDNDIVLRRLTRYDAQPRTVLLLPTSLAPEVVQEAHGQLLTGHNGITQTKERLLQSYYWPTMDYDVTTHVRACQKCQSRRLDTRPQPHLLTPLPQCTEINQRVHVDLFGPLKTSDSGKKYILVMTDAFSKYAEVAAVDNKEASTVSLAIFNRWICRFGTPLEIVSDGGKEFVNKVSQELYKLLDIKHSVTTAYHPQCNAQAERFNQTVGKYLASFTDQSTLDWEMYLAPLAFSYNTSLHRTTKHTPYGLTFGTEARLPTFPSPDIQRHYGESDPSEWFQRLQFSRQLAAHHSLQTSAKAKLDHDRHARQHQYQVGQLVWLQEHNFLGKNRKLAPQWTGPYKICKILPFGVADLEYKNKIYRVNVNRLKPHIAHNVPVTPTAVSQPPSRQQQQHQTIIPQLVPSPYMRAQEAAAADEGGPGTQPGQIQQQEEGTHTETPIQKRGRGRPRKQPQTQTAQQQETNVEESDTHTALRQDSPTQPSALQEKRVTRAMTARGEAQLVQGHILGVQQQQQTCLQWRPITE